MLLGLAFELVLVYRNLAIPKEGEQPPVASSPLSELLDCRLMVKLARVILPPARVLFGGPVAIGCFVE